MIPKTPGYRVLIKPDSLEEFDPVVASAKSSIPGFEFAATEERQERTAIDTGTVLEIGPVAFVDRGGKENWCEVGDRVSYARHGGKSLKDPKNPDTRYLVVNDEDIIMVWKEET